MRIFFDFDPEEATGIEIPKARRAEASAVVADYVRERVLETVGKGESPVEGESWKKGLSPEYRKRKAQYSSVTFANMELKGDLLDSLEVVQRKGGKLRLKVGEDQNDKADGHCNFSGKSKLPRRRFIPGKGQGLKKDIVEGMREIMITFAEED